MRASLPRPSTSCAGMIASAVDELEGAAEALDPPAVARRAVRMPCVERIAPVLAEPIQRIRRRTRDLASLEQLGMRDVLGAAGRDVDRHVPDQPHAALAR